MINLLASLLSQFINILTEKNKVTMLTILSNVELPHKQADATIKSTLWAQKAIDTTTII